MQADVLLVTSWGVACGIAEHAAMLKDAVETQSALRLCIPSGSGFQPVHPKVIDDNWEGWPIIHLNYHAALHSAWTPEWVAHFEVKRNARVIVTYHDTGVPNSEQCQRLYDVASEFIVHEPAEDLGLSAHYWRMGVSEPASPLLFGTREPYEANGHFPDSVCFKRYSVQPVLGTIGFPFPWKNYDSLAQVTRDLGWALLLIAPQATDAQIATWRMTNPDTHVRTEFLPRQTALSLLSGCDATAFTYVCHNTGQSGALLQGIAARKPVIALKTCRQFRALYEDPLGRSTIKWAETFLDVAAHLRHVKIQRIDPGILALAEQESWAGVGLKHIQLYQELLAR